MNNSTNINIRIEKDIKDASEKIFDSLGLNMSTAINIYLRQVIRTNGIPFEIKGEIPNKQTLDAMSEAIKVSNDGNKGYSTIANLRNALGE